VSRDDEYRIKNGPAAIQRLPFVFFGRAVVGSRECGVARLIHSLIDALMRWACVWMLEGCGGLTVGCVCAWGMCRGSVGRCGMCAWGMRRASVGRCGMWSEAY